LNSISWKYELKIKLNDLYYLVRIPNYSAEHKQTIYRIKFEFKRLVKRRKRNLKRQFQSNKIETFFDFYRAYLTTNINQIITLGKTSFN
jgi:hypothetical protein